MAQKKHTAKKLDWKDVFESDTDGLRALVQVLEAEMDEAVRAQKNEGTDSRVGYGSAQRPLQTKTAGNHVGSVTVGAEG
jgi:hypothetical protein